VAAARQSGAAAARASNQHGAGLVKPPLRVARMAALMAALCQAWRRRG